MALYEKSREWSLARREREKLVENPPTMKSPLNLFRLVDANGERLKELQTIKNFASRFSSFSQSFACQKSSSSSSPHSDNMERGPKED